MSYQKLYRDIDLRRLLKTKLDKKQVSLTDASGVTINVRKSCHNPINTITFRLRYQGGGKALNISLGTYPEMSISQARVAWEATKAKVLTGEYEREERKSKAVSTFGELWTMWTNKQLAGKTENTAKKYLSVWKNYLCKIGGKRIEDINPAMIMELVEPLCSVGKVTTARRVVTYARGAMDLAEVLQMVPYNPLGKLIKFLPKEKPTHYAAFSDLTQEKEMRELFKAFHDADPKIQCLLWMYFFTLLRNVEVRRLRFSDIHDGVIETKTKTMRAFRVPLSTQAQKILDYMRSIHKSQLCDYVFEGMAENGCVSEMTLPKALRVRGFGDRLKVHGIRTLGRQFLETVPDAKESLIEMCLSHVNGSKVAQAYNRGEYLEERRALMQKWGDYVERCIGEQFRRILGL